MNFSAVTALTRTADAGMSLAEKSLISAKVVLTGFVVVFAVLVFLILIIKLYSAIVQKAQGAERKQKKAKVVLQQSTAAVIPAKPTVPASSVSDGVPDEVVAVISAAVASTLGSSDKVRIKSIKKSSDGSRSAWARAGVLDNTRPF